MIDWTKPIQTRGGWPARLVCTDFKNGDFCNLVVVTNEYGIDVAWAVDCNGNGPVGKKIINVPPQPVKVEAWVVFWPSGEVFTAFSSKAEADYTASQYTGMRVVFMTGEDTP